jgi:serine/threonine protein kinase
VHYNPPEVFEGKNPYDGEKADIWASAFILLILYSGDRFSKGEQCLSDYYSSFLSIGSLDEFWKDKNL